MLSVTNLRSLMVGPVSLEIGDGECVAVTGPSGAGKSVLLRAIADLDPAEGQARTGTIQRETVPAPLWRRHVALLPAESGWWGERVHSHFQAPDTLRPRLSELGLPPEAMDWEVSRLSTGERHRLALLRSLEMGPEVLMLDEPTTMLDQQATALAEAMLKREMARGLSLLLVTHDPGQPGRLAQRTFWLESGALHEKPAAQVQSP